MTSTTGRIVDRMGTTGTHFPHLPFYKCATQVPRSAHCRRWNAISYLRMRVAYSNLIEQEAL